jgi:hypothetical protein
MGYIVIYRAAMERPHQPVCIAGDGYAIYLMPGPVTIWVATASEDPTPPADHVALKLSNEKREFVAGPFVLLTVQARVSPEDGWTIANRRFSECAALLDVEFPGILHEKLYEGTFLTPQNPLFLSWPEGYRFAPKGGYDPVKVETQLTAHAGRVAALPSDVADRFALAARWFRRATESGNLIDQALFYYLTLEVFPTMSRADVPNRVAQYLAAQLYSEFDWKVVKRRLDLGRIAGFRAEIVHRGRASVDQSERASVLSYVERLRAMSRTCLRLLAGLPPGDDLDRYVRVRTDP